MSDLRELRDRVAGGNAPEYSLFKEAYIPSCWAALPLKQREKSFAAYNGSLDAARALHEALLPGWHWRITRGKYTPCAIVQRDIIAGEHQEAEADYPARAWLLAILDALIAKDTDDAD